VRFFDAERLMVGIHAFIAQGAAADDLSCETVTEVRRLPSL